MEISRIIRTSRNPMIYLGYVVAEPQSKEYYRLMKRDVTPSDDSLFDFRPAYLDETPNDAFNAPRVKDGYESRCTDEDQDECAFLEPNEGVVYDIDASDQDRWCQYIGYNGPGMTKIGYARITHGGVTDTEFQTAKFGIFPPHDDDKHTLVRHRLAVYELKDSMKKFFRDYTYGAHRTMGNHKLFYQDLPKSFQRWRFPPSVHQGARNHTFYIHKSFFQE